MMNIEYGNSNIAKYFNNWEWFGKKCGCEIAKATKKRRSQLQAARNLADYFKTGLGRPHFLEGNLSDCIGVTVTGNMRIVLRVVGYEPSQSMESKMRIDNLIIIGVGDYHGGKYEWIIS